MNHFTASFLNSWRKWLMKLQDRINVRIICKTDAIKIPVHLRGICFKNPLIDNKICYLKAKISPKHGFKYLVKLPKQLQLSSVYTTKALAFKRVSWDNGTMCKMSRKQEWTKSEWFVDCTAIFTATDVWTDELSSEEIDSVEDKVKRKRKARDRCTNWSWNREVSDHHFCASKLISSISDKSSAKHLNMPSYYHINAHGIWTYCVETCRLHSIDGNVLSTRTLAHGNCWNIWG